MRLGGHRCNLETKGGARLQVRSQHCTLNSRSSSIQTFLTSKPDANLETRAGSELDQPGLLTNQGRDLVDVAVEILRRDHPPRRPLRQTNSGPFPCFSSDFSLQVRMSRHSDTARANRLRRSGALACLAWLNLAMLPCTMAVADASDCPDCPPAAMDEHAGHGQHARTHEVGHHDAHAVASDTPADSHCGVAEPECCELDELRADDRSQKLDRDAGSFVAATLFDDAWYDDRFANGSIKLATGPPRCSTGGVRLHAFLSVYRD